MIESLFGESGPTTAGIAVIAAAVVVVLLLIYWIVKRRGPMTFLRGGANRQPRLAVIDAAPIDSRRRLVLVRRDNVEHLVMIGGPSDIVVESRIVRADNTRVAKKPAQPARAAPVEDRKPAPVPVPAPVPAPQPPAPAPAPEATPEKTTRPATAANDQKPAPQPPRPVQEAKPAAPPKAIEPVPAPAPEPRRARAPVVTPTTRKQAAGKANATTEPAAAEKPSKSPAQNVVQPVPGPGKPDMDKPASATPAPPAPGAVVIPVAAEAKAERKPAQDQSKDKKSEAPAVEPASDKQEASAANQDKAPEAGAESIDAAGPSKARELIGEFDEMLESELIKDEPITVEPPVVADADSKSASNPNASLEDEMKKLLGDLSTKR
ncbi:flagellar biosynthetic protein FliO [Hoeflea sp. WL0058]|uniref:Flagellar biosynthetic protein FliO n=1 Tax=Flavimaribacter sediminis TaxID=2865987 RepID=A0AAE3D064_9HYPH|nr:flagellar biosynthetic protein FliO [Flavimaribacter sediminis]MBW8636458.1 flagellar biosynthetic protein FliO [Flavimaribacter sediminis]